MDAVAVRGSLRVYAGMCEGAGTTHRMLEEGTRLRAAGRDVVLAVLGDEPSPAIARLASGLKRVAPVSVAYRGVTVEALDADAVVARRPEVALVDELWREAPPGLQPATRWAAAELVRDAGIDVVATVDLGHLASQADAVQTITGVPVRERLPDSVLDGADEVELVDVSPSTLRARIADGLVVPPDRARRLLDSVYTTANLATLRDLSLRWLARRIESEVGAPLGMGERAPGAAVIVVVDGGQGTRDAIRRAAALSAALRLRLVAVTADERAPRADAWPLDAGAAAEDLNLARDLGAEILPVAAADAAGAVAAAAQRLGAGLVVLAPRAPSLGDRLRGRTLLERIMAARPGLEVHLVPVRDTSG